MTRQELFSTLQNASGASVRAAVRANQWPWPTAGLAQGYVQCNLVVLPQALAGDFAEFCRRNPAPCPLVDQTAPGDFVPRRAAPNADLRYDVPRYRLFIHGAAQSIELSNVESYWNSQMVAFLLGCSFTFETALTRAGLPVRHLEQGRNVPMYVTNRACVPAGPFAGPLVVSMRPYCQADLPRVQAVTQQFPAMHGGPVHVGDPAAIGIRDLSRPDFGDAVDIHPEEVPVFWACGVTPQMVLQSARPELAITHSPGCMFVTDLQDDAFREAG